MTHRSYTCLKWNLFFLQSYSFPYISFFKKWCHLPHSPVREKTGILLDSSFLLFTSMEHRFWLLHHYIAQTSFPLQSYCLSSILYHLWPGSLLRCHLFFLLLAAGIVISSPSSYHVTFQYKIFQWFSIPLEINFTLSWPTRSFKIWVLLKSPALVMSKHLQFSEWARVSHLCGFANVDLLCVV